MKHKVKESNINDNVSEYLSGYLDIPNPQFAVMLTGKWGSGKTFFIKKEVEKWKTEYVQQDVDDDNVVLQPIYLSLYGLSSIKQLVQKLKEKISPFWHSKYMKLAKNVGLSLLKATAKIDLKTDDGDTSVNAELNLIDIFKNEDKSIKGNKIFVFDDLERSEIPLNQLFGFINEFVEHHKCKVIIICDEEKLKKISKKNSNKSFKSLKYDDFKEKLVGQTLEVNADYKSAIKIFIKEKSINYTNLFDDNKGLILDIFVASRTENLRILRQFFSDFERFFHPINNKYVEHHKFSLIKKSLLVHFLIFYLEYKSGNKHIVNWRNSMHLFTERIRKNVGADKEKKSKKSIAYDKLSDKYNLILNSNLRAEIYNLIDYHFYCNYIEKGFVYYNNIFELIDKNQILEQEEEQQDWEKLYGWRVINDNEVFEKLKEKEISKFKNGEIKDVGILTHLYYVFYNLKYANLLSEEIELDKNYIKNLKENLNGIKDTVPNIRMDYYGIPFQSVDITTKDRINLDQTIEEAKKLISNHNSKIAKEKIAGIVLTLNNDNIDEFKPNLHQSPHFGANPMWTYNIFQGVKVNDFYKVFNSLELPQRIQFLYLLKRNRYTDTQNYLENESSFLIEFKTKLEEESEKLESIERFQFQSCINILADIIKKKS